LKGSFRMLKSRIAGVAAVEADTRHTFPPHTHEQYGIGVIYRGAHRSRSSRGVVEAGCGDVITVNPGEVHDGAPINEAGRSWRILYCDPSLVAEAIGDISEGSTRGFEFSNPVIADADIARRVQRLFAAITDERSGHGGGCGGGLLALLAAVIDRTDRDRSRGMPPSIDRAKALIDDDPAAPITLSDLARESGLSQFKVLRGFAKATGLTPHAYIVQRRIDRARQLIAGGTPLAAAAAVSGFADQSHMTRVFVRKYGISPGIYADTIA